MLSKSKLFTIDCNGRKCIAVNTIHILMQSNEFSLTKLNQKVHNHQKRRKLIYERALIRKTIR